MGGIGLTEPARRQERWAVSAEGLGKSYLLWNRPQDRLKQGLRWALPSWLPLRQKIYYREFWALKGVSLTIRRGETVGIIGRNGSGKSTLLQLICGTLRKSCGTLETRGRISALLELGSGFNYEFSGRDNIFMNAAVLGLSDREIEEKYEEIVDYADIGDFIDQPLKHYSSGMSMRLAFAVAISVSPNILVVDEALAVGDEMFQRKCFASIRAIQEAGGTILFVSHAAGTVVDLCSRALLLDAGELICEGSPKAVVAGYHKLLNAPADRYHAVREELRAKTAPSADDHSSEEEKEVSGASEEMEQSGRPSDQAAYFDPHLVPKNPISYVRRGARIDDWRICTRDGRRVNHLVRGELYVYSYSVEFYERCRHVRFGMLIKTLTGFELGGSASHTVSDAIPVVEKGARLRVQWSFRCRLFPGTYFCNAGVLGLAGDSEAFLDRCIDALAFRVIPENDMRGTLIVDFGVTCRIDEVGSERRSTDSPIHESSDQR